jgi:hypothetical protein
MLGFTMLALLFTTIPATAQNKDSGKKKSIGFILSEEASAQEVGLPIYPGARRHKDESEDSAALQLGLWGGSSGFRLVLLKLESDDSPEKVAAFYRKALAKYGQVVECTPASAKAGKSSKDNSSNQLDCSADRPERGLTLKAGVKEKQHAVGIQAHGDHSLLQLVYIETPKSD